MERVPPTAQRSRSSASEPDQPSWIAAIIPHAERAVTEGAGHIVDGTLLAPVIGRFFAAP